MRKGFSLLETVFAVSIFAFVIGMSMKTWMLFMYKSNRANTQASLDMDARRVIERFRSEMRNTARETIIFYPANREPYEAVGFALAADQDNDGLMDMGPGGSNILWRQSVIYHVWNHSPHQMRRTVFSNRNPAATYADRYNQIATVVTSGDGGGACLAGETTSSLVLFENLFTGRLWHAEAKFDGYAAGANTREKIAFGSLPLAAGEHTINFTIAGQNPNSTGRKLRLDQVSAGVAGWPLEAELCVVGGVASAPAFVGQGMASAVYGLTAASSSDGDKLSVTVYNDAIEECSFIGETRIGTKRYVRNVTFSNTVVRLDPTYTPAGFDQGVLVTKLDGAFKTTWWGNVQAEKLSPDAVGRDASPSDLLYKPGTNCAIRIPVRGEYVRTDGYGPVFRMYKSAFNNNLKILKPAFAPTETPDSPNITETNLFPLAIYQNGVQKASWADCVAGGVDFRIATESLKPVFMGQHFIFSFQMVISNPNDDAIRAFRIDDAGWPCWVMKGGDAVTAMQPVWTGYEVVREKENTGAWKPCLPGLVCMVVNYAETGDYVSHPFDTMIESGAAKSFSWEADVPSGSGLTMSARGGNVLTEDRFGIADASDWENVGAVANGDTFTGNTGRYVQFRAVFSAQPAKNYPGAGGVGSTGPYRSATPRLRRALFTWDGEEKYVDVSAELLKSPDCGLFTVDVDGREMVQGVTMEIEIFKDVLTQGSVKERLRSAMTAEVEPRNSGK